MPRATGMGPQPHQSAFYFRIRPNSHERRIGRFAQTMIN
jgi:hypothetical protein